jgi:hypothetical protein
LPAFILSHSMKNHHTKHIHFYPGVSISSPVLHL